MFALRRGVTDQLLRETSALLARIQRLEEDQGQLRARLEADRDLRLFIVHIAAAAQVAPAIGAAIEGFAETMRTRPPRGRAGGVARCSTAWRYSDGTFMPESKKAEAYRAEYERYAAGGRARVASAVRAPDGTFI
jgi:hypothetical protein